jgi:hypothetical protein
VLVLDSGAVSKLARRGRQTVAYLAVLQRRGLWPPVVPSVVVAECVTGRSGPDADTNRLLATCDLRTEVPESMARRAARMRFLARKGSAIDAIVVATAEPSGTVLTGDAKDLTALAAHAADVTVEAL